MKNLKKYDFEIIVVCNGCTDKTPEIVKEFSSDKPEIKLLVFEKILGKGGAVLEGFKSANGDIVGFTDADDSISADEFEKLIKFLNTYDCAIGSKAIKGSEALIKQSLIRRFLARVFRQYVNILFRLNIKDTQCGTKFFLKKCG